MSCCFDHGWDAWESREQELLWGGTGPSYVAGGDPLYYHKMVSFNYLKRETEKAYLVSLQGGQTQWIPKKICREFNEEEGYVYVHKSTYSKILEDKPKRPSIRGYG